MLRLNKFLFSASAVMAAALVGATPHAAYAQADDTTEVDQPADAEEFEDATCIDDADCIDVEETATEAEAETEEVPVEAEDTAGEPALITPGSTDESNPGGSTTPGTTPDN